MLFYLGLTGQPYAHDQHDGGEWQGLGGLVDPSNSVDKTPHTEKWESEETAGEDHIPHPVVTSYLVEEIGRDIASNA